MISRRGSMALIGAGIAMGCAGTARAAYPTQFGVNANRIFLSGIQRGGSFDTALVARLGRRGVPFVRFAASAQWAGDWARYAEDPQRYWQGMATIFAAAEQHGVKLLPTVLWHTVALAFHLREPMQAWRDPASRTSSFARRYTEEFAERFDRSPALMMYEFTNELNLYIDDPRRLQSWPVRDPTMPDRRPVPRDLLTTADLRAITGRFAADVRRHSRKPISAGTAVPRGHQWHVARGSRDLDTRDQFVAHFRAITPPGVNVLSCHLYDVLWPWPKEPDTVDEVLAAFVDAAEADRRVALLGEFGVARMADRAAEERRFRTYVEQIRSHRIPYAALWNVSSGRFQAEWDVIPGGDRDYQIELLVAANRQG